MSAFIIIFKYMKKESLTVYIPKMILTVSAIVSFGALIGAVGYLIAHPEWKIVPPIILLFEKDITVVSDRSEHRQDEDIKITIENNLDKPVYLGGCNPYVIQKKIDSQWNGEPVNCFWEGNSSKINAKSVENFVVNAENNQNRNGIYRIRVDYYKDCLLDNLPISQSKCGEVNTVYSDGFTIKEKTVTAIGNGLEIETIEKKLYSMNTERKNYVIKSSKEWANLWVKIGNTKIVPVIDFNRDMIIAVFQGENSTGGYDIEIGSITEKENTIDVSVTESSPGKNCMVTQAFTSPFHIVKIQRSDKEVLFNMVKEIQDCN